MLAPALFAPVCAGVWVRARTCIRGTRCFTRQMLITDDSDRDRDSDSCPVLFDTYADYRSKAPYESKNYRRRATHTFFPSLSLLFLRRKTKLPPFSNLSKMFHTFRWHDTFYWSMRFIFRICFMMKEDVTNRHVSFVLWFSIEFKKKKKISGFSSNEL